MRKTSGTLAFLTAALLSVSAPRALAQGGFLFEGVTDLELRKTDSLSRLLSRNGGRVGLIARADIWAAIEPVRNVVLFGELAHEWGSARDPDASTGYVKQGGVRFSPSDAIAIEAGMVRQIVGTFSSRSLSFRNPLIGTPDGYATTYPVGARVDGSIQKFDYRAGVIWKPLFRPGYTPDPGSATRGAIGAGFTPTMGIRFGGSAMTGPYLNDELTAAQLRDRDWRRYRQHVVAGDAQISRGYFELQAEVAWSSYDVPGRDTPITGILFYLEPRYTISPRLFVAARYERNDYPFIRPQGATGWTAIEALFGDVELGGGFRPTATSILKLSVRADRWRPSSNPNRLNYDGYAVVAQWSQTYDFVQLATSRR